MADHEGKEETVEFLAAGAVQLPELFLTEHSRHQHVVLHATHSRSQVRCVGVRHRFLPFPKPLAHQRDFVPLCNDYALAQDSDRLAGSVRRCPSRYQDCLCVVRDHSRHEVHVRRGVRVLSQGEVRLGAGGGGLNHPWSRASCPRP
jgi:hypothetical protein